jgi:glucose/mannose-6-phosphate isomerase
MNMEPPTAAVFAGLGGSSIAGDILVDYCRGNVPVPVATCRTLDIPRFVGKNTLFVAISYSGDTQETLSMVEQAKSCHANLVVISSGGKLLEEALSAGLPYIKVLSSMPPRVALPELVAAVAQVLGEAGVIKNVDRLLDSAAKSTRTLLDNVKFAVPLAKNSAKQAASSLAGHLPLLIGSEENSSVLRRFKNELNENSKVPAIPYTLPEAYHNDIEGFKSLNDLSSPQPFILRSPIQSQSESSTTKKLLEAFSRFGYPPPLFFSGIGDERFGWLLSAITFGDLVSFYLAMLNGVDPSQLLLIPHFKGLV